VRSLRSGTSLACSFAPASVPWSLPWRRKSPLLTRYCPAFRHRASDNYYMRYQAVPTSIYRVTQGAAFSICTR
jgi:hypothetical protein